MFPSVFTDERGAFVEAYKSTTFANFSVMPEFVQDNVSISKQGVIRGLHLQYPSEQAKFISVLQGAVFDVAVDVRVGSPWFGQFVAVELTAPCGGQFYIPEGFAHGFQALTDDTILLYKCTHEYSPLDELTIQALDPELGIEWPLSPSFVSKRDAGALPIAAILIDKLPKFERNLS